MTEDDKTYLARRAATESEMAVRSPSSSARKVHAEMAGLYAGQMSSILRLVLGDKADSVVEAPEATPERSVGVN